jgi:CheY-like chemotaxis protein
MNHPPRILIVDDNEVNCDIIVTRLEAHGYETLQPPTAWRRWPPSRSTVPIWSCST